MVVLVITRMMTMSEQVIVKGKGVLQRIDSRSIEASVIKLIPDPISHQSVNQSVIQFSFESIKT